ncbi:MAG: hypothetical protein WAR57_06180 [Candidatus Phosphoribacter sp.]
MGLFSKKSNDDEEDWTTECRNFGGTAVNSTFCSEACSLEHWEQQQRSSSGRTYNTIPTVLLAEAPGHANVAKMTIKGVEDAKIECARKFFANVNKKFEGQVKYDVADNYSKLMELVTA